MSNVIKDFLQQDTKMLEKIIQEYPKQIPVKIIAEWWVCRPNRPLCAVVLMYANNILIIKNDHKCAKCEQCKLEWNVYRLVCVPVLCRKKQEETK